MSKIKIPIEVFSLDGEGYHLKVDIKINNIPFKAILDTGASKTAFDRDLLKKLVKDIDLITVDKLSTGLGTNSMVCDLAFINELKIGDFLAKNFEAAALDLSHINVAYDQLGLENVIGVIGSDILVRYEAKIDFKSKTLILTDL